MAHENIQASFDKYDERDLGVSIEKAQEQLHAVQQDPMLSDEDRYCALHATAADLTAECDSEDLFSSHGGVLINNGAFYETLATWNKKGENPYDEDLPLPLTLHAPLRGPILGTLRRVYVREIESMAGTPCTITWEIEPTYADELAAQWLEPGQPIFLNLEDSKNMTLLNPASAIHPLESNFEHAIRGLTSIPCEQRTPQHINAVFEGIMSSPTLQGYDTQAIIDWVLDRFNGFLHYGEELFRFETQEAVLYKPEKQETDESGQIVNGAIFEGRVAGFIDMQNYKIGGTPGNSEFIPYHKPKKPILGLVMLKEYGDGESEIVHIPLKYCRRIAPVSH